VSAKISLEAGVETLQHVARGSDAAVREIVEHIRDGMLNERHGFLEIFECHTGAGEHFDKGLMLHTPVPEAAQERAAVLVGFDAVKPPQDDLQIPARLGFREDAQPAQPLTLDVVETPLNADVRPDLLDGAKNGLMSVDGNRMRLQSFAFELGQVGMDRIIAFLTHIGVKENVLSQRIHQDDQTPRFMKVGSIKKHVLVLRVVEGFHGYLAQPEILDPMQFGMAVA